ncbi:hypothetical protein ABT160_33355 [Streptomyces sp. NPDC001941]|uniref:hypothetical protein n=1 Tax=Streptomyces sp. NPDC001941 TaxID=3154659 RepID=UPI00332B8943
MDDDAGWDMRLGWAHGLIASDPEQRAAALVRLSYARRHTEDALGRSQEIWHLTAPLGPAEQYREPAFLEALEAYQHVQSCSLPDALWGRPTGAGITTWPGLPYALLFLEWEARYPQEWTTHAKSWTTKEHLLRDLAVEGHDERVRAKLVELTDIVVRRAHRCKDREYVRIARAVDGVDLRERLGAAAQSDSPWARCHARYVLWLLDRPEVPNSLHVWRTWLAQASAGD